MAFKRNLDDPIQRKRQAYDDVLSGKTKRMTLEPAVPKQADAKIDVEGSPAPAKKKAAKKPSKKKSAIKK